MAYRASEPMTLAEYEQLPDDPRYRDELSRGRLVREPQPGHEHGRVQVRLAGLLERFVTERGLGYVVVESGFVLERNPDTVRGPDIAFVARASYGDALPARWIERGPDLAVEILSPTDRLTTLMEKITQYFAAGTRLVWLIDPQTRSATAHKPDGPLRVVHEDEVLTGDDVLPTFSCALRQIFD